MAQDFSEDMVRQLFAAEPEEPVLLVTLEADGLEDAIRVSSHDGRIQGSPTRGLVSRGDTYVFTPFNFTWPGAGEGQPSREAKLEMFNRSGEVTEAVRTATGNPTVTVELVRYSAPDTVELAITAAEVSDVEIDDPKAVATIKSKRFDTEPACKASYVPSRTPGAY